MVNSFNTSVKLDYQINNQRPKQPEIGWMNSQLASLDCRIFTKQKSLAEFGSVMREATDWNTFDAHGFLTR